jgi:hypothetical protein
MATGTRSDDARRQRADARRDRRSSSEEPRERQSEPAQQQSSGGGGTSTMTLVALGAAVGGAAGIAKALLDRRHGRGEPSSQQHEDDDVEREEKQPERTAAKPKQKQKSKQQPMQIRDLATTVLEAALDAVREQDGGRRDDDEDEADADEPQSRDRSQHEEEDDEDEEDDEYDTVPRGAARDDEPGGEAPRGEEDDEAEEDDEDDEDDEGDGEAHADGSGRVPVELVRRAKTQLAELVGREPEAVTSVESSNGGWRLQLQVVELERIPSSTDVLACYEVHLDGDGDLVDYARTHRYHRSQAEAEVRP